MLKKIWWDCLGPALFALFLLLSVFGLVAACCSVMAVDWFGVCSGFTHFFEGSAFCPVCGVQLHCLPVFCEICGSQIYGNFCCDCGAFSGGEH